MIEAGAVLAGCHSGGGRRHRWRRVLTSLVRLQLSLQVFGGHVKVLILSVSGPRFTPPAAAVTAAAQAAAEVAAGGQAADDEQSLQEEDPGVSTLNKRRARAAGRLLPSPTSWTGRSKC